jgi:hypothetical protein
MQKFLSALAVICAFGLAACGKGSGPEGTWTLDVEGSVAANMGTLKPTQPTETSPENVRRKEALARQVFAGMKVSITIKSDHTFVNNAMVGTLPQEIVGTWSQSGDQVTFQAKTREGKPVQGADAAPMVMTFKDDRLTGNPAGAIPIAIVLKRG